MDALEFLKERKRMCNLYKDCKGCPLYDINCVIDSNISDEDCERNAATVERWSKDHPRKTRQSAFLEQYPDADISDDGLPDVAPCQLCVGLIHGESTEDCENRGLCVECRRDFWMHEVE